MRNRKGQTETEINSNPRFPPEALSTETPAWELIEEGRYRPRRIRGSFPGRELG